MKIIYIFGMSHSGSTILDSLLSHFENALGIGEAQAIIQKRKYAFEQTHDMCSCTVSITNCPFWSDIAQINDDTNAWDNFSLHYDAIIQKAMQMNKNILIDSSKTSEHLMHLMQYAQHNGHQLYIISLHKDVRSYLWSMHRIRKQEKKFYRPSLYLAFKWYKLLKKNERFLNTLSHNYLHVSYEKLCWQSYNTLLEIALFCDIPFETFGKISSDHSHIAFGNRAKKVFRNINDIMYSSEWMYSFSFIFGCVFLFPFIISSKKRFETRESKDFS